MTGLLTRHWEKHGQAYLVVLLGALLLGVAALSGCASREDARLEPGPPILAPWGMDSLCENNPEECEDDAE